MTFTNQVLASDLSLTDLLNSSINPAPKLKDVSFAGLLTKGGFNLVDFIFILIGLFFFANLIMAGWDFMLSSGDPKKTQAASTRIVNGLIGLIMAAAAYVIVRLVSQALGLSVSTSTPVI